jgi:tetratricopeptide (TPR) repeat protein
MRVKRAGKLGAALLCSLSTVAMGGPVARAQATMSGHGMGQREETAPQDLPAPLKLEGIGNVHLKITATPEAQSWFDQGLNLRHDFWDYESERAFEQAVRADARCAMCYWGLYQAEVFRARDASRYYARKSLAEALRLQSGVSASEQLYIEAADAHETAIQSAKADANPDFSAEIQIWRKLVAADPGDSQARIFLAEALIDGYDDAGEPHVGQKEALAILQGVLKQEPDNSAANHYWIHAVENSPHPEQALHSAEILAGLAPTSGHMVHMPGHIFYRMGDYQQAERCFVASMEADERYMQAQHVAVDNDWNYVHNLMYATANLMEEGKLKQATELSEKLASARGELASTLYPWSARDGVARLNPRLIVALRAGDWAKALQLLGGSEPSENLANLRFLWQGLTEFASGMLAMESNDLPKAVESSARLHAQLEPISERIKHEAAHTKDHPIDEHADDTPPKLQVMPDAELKPLVADLSVMSYELRASLLVARNKDEDARKLFAAAASREKALGYAEPPIYIRPEGETEGAAWMRAGDCSAAQQAYKRALEERPRSGFALYGIAMCSERSGDGSAARAEYQHFLAAWRSADADLPQVEHARQYLSAASASQ